MFTIFLLNDFDVPLILDYKILGNMKNNRFQLVIISLVLLTLFMLPSCSPLVYTPSSQAVPVLDESGDLKIGADASISNPLYSVLAAGQQTSFRLRGTYAITDNIGAHLETSISADTVDYRTYAGAGLGYYSHLADNTFFQLYLTGRKGQVDYNGDDSWSGSPIKAEYTSIGIQPGVGYETDRCYVGLFTTIKRLNYSLLETTLQANERASLIEPAVGFSYKFGNFSLDSEVGISFELAKKTTNQGYFSVGVGYNLNTRNKMKTTADNRRRKRR